jgi:hypothetical protein
VKYELGFYIPEDTILQGRCRTLVVRTTRWSRGKYRSEVEWSELAQDNLTEYLVCLTAGFSQNYQTKNIVKEWRLLGCYAMWLL